MGHVEHLGRTLGLVVAVWFALAIIFALAFGKFVQVGRGK